jgi:hypothetical protein
MRYNSWSDLTERLAAHCARYRTGEISDDVFKAHLKSLGFIGRALEDEYRYQRLLKEGK